MTEVEEGVAGWSAHAEEVLSWLLEAEDHLAGLNSLGQKHLMTVKTRHAAHTLSQSCHHFSELLLPTFILFAC
jgi:hypothetical protein